MSVVKTYHKLLAIETATEACSAALSVDGQIIERFEIAPRRHAELILPMIEFLLAEAGISRTQIDGIAVGRGPGAFTGVRLAISVAQGLALGLDVPVVPISSLAALALDAPDDAINHDSAILAVIDARMGEIYVGAFRRKGNGLVEAISDEVVTSADKWKLNQSIQIFEEGDVNNLNVPHATRWSVVGTGWRAYGNALSTRLPSPPVFADGERYPQASAVLRLAQSAFARGAGVPPETTLPIYLRDNVALTLEEQRVRST